MGIKKYNQIQLNTLFSSAMQVFIQHSVNRAGGLMERLSPSQQEALEQLQGILGHHNYDVDVLMNVLQTLDWDVQVMMLLEYTNRLCS